MESIIDTQGQTIIPHQIRQHFNLEAGDQLEWIVVNDTIRVMLVREDLIDAFRERGKGGSTARLLTDRANDKDNSEN